MRTIIHALLIVALSLLSPSADAQNYKCKSANGRIEYSDIPCASDKDVLSQPQAGVVASKPLAVPMQQLEIMFKEYETRLCERERLATEIDMANRAGEINKNVDLWKPRQDRLSNLNETLIEFQGKAGKITRATGSDSPESAAMRKYQSKLKDCAKVVAK